MTTLKIQQMSNKDDIYENAILVSKKNFPSIDNLSENLYALIKIQHSQYYFPVKFKSYVSDNSVQLSLPMREKLSLPIDNELSCDIKVINEEFHEIKNLHFEITIPSLSIKQLKGKRLPCKQEISVKLLMENIRTNLSNTLISKEFIFIFNDSMSSNEDYKILLKPVLIFSQDNDVNLHTGKLSANTKIKFNIAEEVFNILCLDDVTFYAQKNLDLTSKINYKLPNIGGLNDQIQRLFKELFLPRIMSTADIKQYGIKFTNGALFYGPPGTGKTLVARELGLNFSSGQNIHITKGPELLNKYVGESERALRQTFEPAFKEWEKRGEHSELHIFIFDEIEALCPSRNMDSIDGKAGVNMTTTLLNLMDGIDQPKNFIVFGLTNLPNSLDPALLRPGRFGLHLEFGLPDLAGRLQILQIHTKSLVKNNLLGEVKLDDWAKRTDNWTGAELERLVFLATTDAIAKNVIFNEDGSVSHNASEDNLAVVTNIAFEKAYHNIEPKFSGDKQQVEQDEFFDYSNELQNIRKDVSIEIDNINEGMITIGIISEKGCGKTSLALSIAKMSQSKCIYKIDYLQLAKLSPAQKLFAIEDKFNRALKSDFGVIILDNIEDILGADPSGIHYFNDLRIYLKNMLNYEIPKGKKLMIIATCNSENLFSRLEFAEICGLQVYINKICEFIDILRILQFLDIITLTDNPAVEIYTGKKLHEPISIKKFLHKIKLYQANSQGSFCQDYFDLEKFFKFSGLITQTDDSLSSYENNSKSNLADNPQSLFLPTLKRIT